MKINKILAIPTIFLGSIVGSMIITRFMPTSNGQTYWSKLQHANAASSIQAVTFVFGSLCPLGMTKLTGANSRFIRISGTGSANTGSLSTGGSSIITIANMPSHTHAGNVSTGGYSVEHHHTNSRLPIENWNATTGATGGGGAYWQPYLELVACVWTN